MHLVWSSKLTLKFVKFQMYLDIVYYFTVSQTLRVTYCPSVPQHVQQYRKQREILFSIHCFANKFSCETLTKATTKRGLQIQDIGLSLLLNSNYSVFNKFNLFIFLNCVKKIEFIFEVHFWSYFQKKCSLSSAKAKMKLMMHLLIKRMVN